MFIFVELGVAIAFGVLGDKEHYNGAAVCEWVVALIYTFYVWSFAIDFIPAIHSKHYQSRETELEAATETAMEERNGQYNGNGQLGGSLPQNGYANAGNGSANGRVVNGVHYPAAAPKSKPQPVEPARNF